MKKLRLLPSAFLLPFLLLPSARAASLTLSDAGLRDSVRAVFGASRLPVPTENARVPGAARVLTAADLDASAGRTLADALRSVPGVVLYDQVGNAYQPTVDLRGFNATPVPATVVLVDGVRVNEADFGQVNWQLIPLSEVERVEILPGPQTLYGPGALGGVISVTTKRGAGKPSGEAEFDAGSYGLKRERLAAGGAAGAFDWRADASRETAAGWRRASRSRLHRASGKLGWRDEKTDATLSYRFADDDLTQAGSLTALEAAADPRQNVSFVENDSLLHQGTLSVRRGLSDETALSFLGDARSRLENTPLNKGRTSVSQARADMDGLSATLQADDRRAVLDRASALTAGVELSRDAVDGTSSGAFGSSPFSNSNRDLQRRLGVFAQESFDLLPGTLIAAAGGRWDRTGLEHEDRKTESKSGARSFHHFSPRLGLNWNPAPSVEAYASVADSFRTPTIDEITALGPFSSAPDLKPVRARSFEAGARFHLGAWGEASAAVYRSVARDEIYPVYDPTAGYGQNKNIDKVRRDGLELSVKPRWSGLLDGFVTYGYAEATFQTDFVLDKAPYPATQTVHRGDFLPAVPRHRWSAGANFHPAKGATVSVDGLCVSSTYLFGDESNTEPRLGGYCVLGGGASYERGAVRVFVRGDNLLDRRYETRGILGKNPTTSLLDRFVLPAPGLAVSGGVRVRVGG